jgi:hypothetical protein
MPNKLNPNMPIPMVDGLTIADFWAWAYSDIISNTDRAVFAEFIVAAALGLTDTPRQPWLPFDLVYKDRKIEVKTSAYLQAWHQERPSQIRFSIKKARHWDPQTNKLSDHSQRNADCFVFCLYGEKDPSKLNLLNIHAWCFYVISTDRLTQQVGDQKSLALSKLRSLCTPVPFTALKQRIDRALFPP